LRVGTYDKVGMVDHFQGVWVIQRQTFVRRRCRGTDRNQNQFVASGVDEMPEGRFGGNRSIPPLLIQPLLETIPVLVQGCDR
jgi:hypothetical protein